VAYKGMDGIMIKYIDLNSDLGENVGDDEMMLSIVSSANIACGAHAGDAYTMRKTVELAAKYGVNIGAHPGFWDRKNFGRTPMQITQDEVYDLIMYQTGALLSYCISMDKPMTHIKPHGALYNMLMADDDIAMGFVKACNALNIPAMGMPYSAVEKASKVLDVKFIKEGFADRAYTEDGRLMSRSIEHSVLNHGDALHQAIKMVNENKVAVNDKWLDMKIDSICVHGDSKGAVRMAKSIKEAFENLEYRIGIE